VIRDLKSLYTLITDNRVVIFDTNLKSFVEKLNDFESDTRNYDYYYRELKKTQLIEFQNNSGRKYYLQKLL
jgi:hypothetical protein